MVLGFCAPPAWETGQGFLFYVVWHVPEGNPACGHNQPMQATTSPEVTVTPAPIHASDENEAFTAAEINHAYEAAFKALRPRVLFAKVHGHMDSVIRIDREIRALQLKRAELLQKVVSKLEIA